MNMSQQRFFLLLHKLEGIETALVAARKEIGEMAEFVGQINEITQVLNFRLLFAGQALLGKSLPGFNENGQKEYNKGLGSTPFDKPTSAGAGVSSSRRRSAEEDKPR
jgi:hypothetical protein